MVKLGIDYECPAPDWWANGGRDLWDSVLDDPSDASVVLDPALAQSVLEQASAIPGWDGGHDFAPHPLQLIELNDDDESW
jgi:hypothetical protein